MPDTDTTPRISPRLAATIAALTIVTIAYLDLNNRVSDIEQDRALRDLYCTTAKADGDLERILTDC